MPTQTVNQDGSVIAKRIEKEVATFGDIMWGALGQKSANPAKRYEMITAAFDNLSTFLGKTLAAAPAEKIVRPGTATAGTKGKPMNVSAKLQADIAQTKARIAALQGGGSIGPAISAKPQPVVDDAQPEDLQAALDALRETVASLLDEIEVLSASAPVAKGAMDPNAGPWHGVFTRPRERAEVIAKIAKRAQQTTFDGVWTGLPRA